MAPEDGKVFECCICYMGMEPGEKIVQLACHELHVLHEDCYTNFVKHFNHEALCPLCRAFVEENKVIKSVMPHKPAEKVVEIED